MISHLLRITSVTALIVLCTFLPFLPGRYDSFAVPLSMMAQAIGKLGLLLVPVGALWMAFEYRGQHGSKRYAFAVTTLIVSSVIWVLVSLFLIIESVALGLGVFGLGVFVVMRLLPRLNLQLPSCVKARLGSCRAVIRLT
jgi:archaellum biogenesis protein FlaJ (TadC family)